MRWGGEGLHALSSGVLESSACSAGVTGCALPGLRRIWRMGTCAAASAASMPSFSLGSSNSSARPPAPPASSLYYMRRV